MNDSSPGEIADLQVLLDVSAKLGATTALVPLLEEIAAAGIRVLDCERVSVFLYDRAAHELYSKVATGEREIRFPADRGIAGESVRTGKIINVPDAYADPRFNPEVDKQTGYQTRSILSCPLYGYQGDLVGVLQVLNCRDRSFSDRCERLAATLSSLAGVAVQRQMLLEEYAAKQKLERDLGLAREIQQSLLPKDNPICPGYSIAGFNAPADATGGDCYDYVDFGPDRVGLLVADATGHGIGPALIVSQLRAMIRALAAEQMGADQILCRVNDLLSEDVPSGMFVTALLGWLDPPSGLIHYISAGQAPLLVYRRQSQMFVELDANALPLGIESPLQFDEIQPIELARGDIFLIVTDGFFEWCNPAGEAFGVQRIAEVVRDNADAAADELITSIRRAVSAFVGAIPQADDLTAIAIKRLAQ